MLRGELSSKSSDDQKQRGIGRLIDKEGRTQYHIITSWWANLVIAGFGVLLALCFILMIFIYQNRSAVNSLEQQVDQQDQKLNNITGK